MTASRQAQAILASTWAAATATAVRAAKATASPPEVDAGLRGSLGTSRPEVRQSASSAMPLGGASR